MKNKDSNSIQAFWVAIGSIISYGFILLSFMILSRFFSKGDYGTYKQIMYVYNTLLVVFTLGLPRAYSYFLPRVPLSEAKDVINKITYLFFALGVLFSALLFFSSGLIADFLKNEDLNSGLKLFALVPVFMLPTMGVDGILATYRKSKYIAIYKVLSSFFQLVCVSIPVIFLGGNYESAIIGFNISSLLIFIVALFLKNLPVRNEVKEKTNLSYKEIFGFSIPLLYASLWGILMNSADQFFISNYFGKEVFAEFSNGWMDLPFVNMIVGATSVVLLPVFSKIIHEDEDAYKKIKPLWKNTFEKTAMVIYPILIFCMFFSEVIMIVLFGEKYVSSGSFFRIKLFLNFFNIIAFAPLLLAAGATKYYAKIIAIGAITIIFLEYIFVNIIDSPYTIAIISVLCHIGVIYFFLKKISEFLKTSVVNLFPISLFLKISIISVPLLSLLYYFLVYMQIVDNQIFVLSFGLFVFMVVYLFLSWIFRIDYSIVIQPFLNKIKSN